MSTSAPDVFIKGFINLHGFMLGSLSLILKPKIQNCNQVEIKLQLLQSGKVQMLSSLEPFHPKTVVPFMFNHLYQVKVKSTLWSVLVNKQKIFFFIPKPTVCIIEV